jgi:hypothetical protein
MGKGGRDMKPTIPTVEELDRFYPEQPYDTLEGRILQSTLTPKQQYEAQVKPLNNIFHSECRSEAIKLLVDAYQRGYTLKQLADIYGVSTTTVHRLLKHDEKDDIE